MRSAAQSIEIGVPPDAFFRVLQDYARYPEFVPEVRAVKVGERVNNAVEVTYFLDVKLKVFEFTLRHVENPPLGAHWELVRGGGFMRWNAGAWELEKTPGGTRATYRIDLELTGAVPPSFQRALAERGLPNMLANFKARAERLQR